MGIKQDRNRFKDIIKGKVKQNLGKYISHGEITGKQEDQIVKIPLPSIDIPNFRFGSANDESGVGQGKPGDGDGEGDGPGQGQKVGNQPGQHEFLEMSVEDLAQILGESLSLPNITPRGDKNLEIVKHKYNSLAPTGPKGLKHFKTTYKRALKRSLSSGVFESGQIIIPIKDDFKYKSPKPTKKTEGQAVIFYMMDVSGSMGDEQKKMVQTEVFWINAWLKKNYKNLEIRFIIHDAQAQEVSEDEFFKVSASGGTLISSAYKLAQKMIEEKYNPANWNIYVFQFSDGDNWSEDDNNVCLNLLKNFFLPIVNSFNYGQVSSNYGSGQFLKHLDRVHHQRLLTSLIKDKSEILESIRKFLGKGF